MVQQCEFSTSMYIQNECSYYVTQEHAHFSSSTSKSSSKKTLLGKFGQSIEQEVISFLCVQNEVVYTYGRNFKHNWYLCDIIIIFPVKMT